MAVNFFKRVTPSELKTYIPFNRNTRGTSGRAVYINPALLPRYIELINSKATNQMRLDAAIQGLRALAGGFTSDSNNNNAFCHRTQVDGVEISYSILQDLGPSQKTGVYVTDLKVKASARNFDAAGLYQAELKSGAWVPRKSPIDATVYENGAISAGISSKYGEANKSSAANSAGRMLFKKLGRALNYDLFFIPASQVDHQGTWVSPGQKLNTNRVNAKKLAEVLRSKERSGNNSKIFWHASDHGAQILLDALQLLPAMGVNKLEKQEFALSNPFASVPALARALKNVGIDFNERMVDWRSSSEASLAHQQYSREIGIGFKSEFTRLSKNESISKMPKPKIDFKNDTFFAEAAKRALLGTSQGWA